MQLWQYCHILAMEQYSAHRSSTSTQDLFHPNSWQTPVAAVTVYSAAEDGRKARPKHVEHTCSC